MRLRGRDFRLKNVFGRKMCWTSNTHVPIAQRQCFLQVPKLCTDLDRTLLYMLILTTNSRFIWKNEMPALSTCFLQPLRICFLQPCVSADRMFAASRSRVKSNFLLATQKKNQFFFHLPYARPKSLNRALSKMKLGCLLRPTGNTGNRRTLPNVRAHLCAHVYIYV